MTDSVRRLEEKQSIAFAHQFREARLLSLRDAEAFEEHLHALERLGSYLSRSNDGLKEFAPTLESLSRESPLAFEAAKKHPELHSSFSVLYDEARIARNEAMHHGAVARLLSRNAQEIALIMEDALMAPAKMAKDFMVRSPICAELWHPLSAVRRTMLLNAFSFLPFEKDGKWKIVSDVAVVAYLRSTSGNRKKRLLEPLGDALSGGLVATDAVTCGLEEPIEKLARSMRDAPCLVLSNKRLVGLVTAFDLL